MTSSGTYNFIVYIAFGPSGCYVGVTSTGLGARKRKHLAAVMRGVKGRFYNAIRKHGEESFTFCETASFLTMADALDAERDLVSMVSPAYNLTCGGEGALGYRHTKASLLTMRQAKLGKPGPWRGKKRPPETIEKFRAAKLANPQRYWLGKKRSPETIAKIIATKLAQREAHLD